MPHTITFDTLLYANQLKSVGVPEKQAEMQATLEKKQVDDICAFIDGSLATKKDLKELELKIELKIESSKDKTIIWLGGMIAASVATIIVVLGFLIRLH
ncbi:conserved hypothetical protein [Gammaproteobacteria bacterium]